MAEVILQIESTKEAPRISRSQLARIRGDLEPRFDDAALILSELVSNSVRHGKNGAIHISVRSNGSLVRLEVSDHGPCFDRDGPPGDGLGLSIVDRVADAWGIDPEGSCTVWAELSLD